MTRGGRLRRGGESGRDSCRSALHAVGDVIGDGVIINEGNDGCVADKKWLLKDDDDKMIRTYKQTGAEDMGDSPVDVTAQQHCH